MAILQKAIDQENTTVRKLFRAWDTEVFGTTHSPFGGDMDGDPEEQEEEIDDAMQQVDDDDAAMESDGP